MTSLSTVVFAALSDLEAQAITGAAPLKNPGSFYLGGTTNYGTAKQGTDPVLKPSTAYPDGTTPGLLSYGQYKQSLKA